MSVYTIVDTIYVGTYVGANGIATITVVMPVIFLIGSLGMSVGVGESSLISRSLGEDNKDKTFKTFGNMIVMTVSLALSIVALGF